MTHYADQRWTAVPSPEVTAIILIHRDDEAFKKRFFDKVDVGFDVDDCHIWTGALSDEGYGNFAVKGKTIRAHRIAWIIRFGEPPAERPFLDHIDCLGRFCVNTDHLEPVTNAENGLRATGVGKGNQRVMRSAELIRRAEYRAKYGEDLPF